MLKYTIIDSNNIEKGHGIIICSSYNEHSFKSWISSLSGIPIESINELYYLSVDGKLYKYNQNAFNQRARVYARVSDIYFLLQKRYDSLKKENEEGERQFLIHKRRLENENEELRREIQNEREIRQREIQNEREIRQREEQKINNFKIAFEQSKKNIEKINFENSKEYITKLIANKFLKEFDNEEGKKNSFTISIINSMKKFNEEFMVYCSKYINSFKANSQKIVNEFNIKDNKVLIEHINFIIIGKTGVGKSTFINESLLLPEGKRAKAGIGQSVTDKSAVYESDKLKMVRMWDTQGLDYKISQEFILNEVKRIVENGLKQGPDHYINIILYCVLGEKFQEEDGQLIYEIMKLYPSDNLPVIITQLQAYFIKRAKKMEGKIREILSKYLDKSIVDKIQIRDIVAKEERGEIEVFKARGIPELLKLSVELMGRSITSATCKKFSQEIEKLCKHYVEKQIKYIEQQLKYEMEILEVSRSMYVDDMEDFLENSEKKQIKALSESNLYSKIEDNKYFEDNFITIIKTKFIDIYNNLNDADALKEKQENQNKKNNNKESKPLVIFFIEGRLQELKNMIYEKSKNIFEKIFKSNYQDYINDLRKEQSALNKKFDANCQINDEPEIEKTFKEKLFIYFNDVFFKNMLCVILKLFMNNLKKTLIDYYKKELKENEKMQKIINKKAEDSLKYLTQNLQESLLKELNENFEDKKKIKNRPVEESEDFEDNDSSYRI